MTVFAEYHVTTLTNQQSMS